MRKSLTVERLGFHANLTSERKKKPHGEDTWVQTSRAPQTSSNNPYLIHKVQLPSKSVLKTLAIAMQSVVAPLGQVMRVQTATVSNISFG